MSAAKHEVAEGLLSLPLWAKTAVVLGFPSAVVAFLLAQGAGWVPSPLVSHAAAQVVHERLLEDHAVRMNSMIERMTVGLRVMCENASRDAQAHLNCQNIR